MRQSWCSAVVAVGLLVAVGLFEHCSATVVRVASQDDCVPDPKYVSFMHDHYSVQLLVVNPFVTCADPVNAPCLSDYSYGCSLYNGVFVHCGSGSRMQRAGRCAPGKFIYTSDFNPGNHVLAIVFDPVRGMEDIEFNVNRSAELTAPFFQQFWGELLSHTAGSSFNSGIDKDKGGVVINPPAHREYHQMHIHAGTYRTPKFEECLNTMAPSTSWQVVQCPGLSEAGGPCLPSGCQTAVLAFKTVNFTNGELGAVWTYYREALDVLAPNHTAVPRNELLYHSAVALTRGPQLQDFPSLVFMIVYASVDELKDSGLGRGHFLCKGTVDDHHC